MAGEPRGPFREESLERLSSPERLDQLLEVVDQRRWLPLLTLGLLLAALLVWSVAGYIPVNVEGRGILIRPRGIVELQAPGSGYVERWNVAVDDLVERGQILGTIARPDLALQIDLLKIKGQELTALREAARLLDEHGPAGERGESHLEAVRRVAQDLRGRGQELLHRERTSLEDQLSLARHFEGSVRERLERHEELRDLGLLAPEDVVDAEMTRRDAAARVAALETQLGELDRRELENDDRYLDRLQQLAEFRLDLETYEQRAADVEREIDTLEARAGQESRIISEHGGRILEITVAVGQYLTPGQRLGALDIGDPETPLLGLAYFTVRDGKRLTEGAEIRVTPDSVERERYGSIKGHVSSVSDFPVTLAQAAGMIGNRELAETLLAGGYRMEVLADLVADPQTPSGFRWSSSTGPSMQFSAGTTTVARVAVEKRPPITFVLPFLKETLGVE